MKERINKEKEQKKTYTINQSQWLSRVLCKQQDDFGNNADITYHYRIPNDDKMKPCITFMIFIKLLKYWLLLWYSRPIINHTNDVNLIIDEDVQLEWYQASNEYY